MKASHGKVKPTHLAFEVAKEILEKAKQPLNPNQMYDWAVKFGLVEQLNFTGKTPHASFASYIYTDLKNNPNTIFELVQTKPNKRTRYSNQ